MDYFTKASAYICLDFFLLFLSTFLHSEFVISPSHCSPDIQGDHRLFLELISGWASDGMQMPVPMLRNMLRQAKLSEEGRKTIIALVREIKFSKQCQYA